MLPPFVSRVLVAIVLAIALTGCSKLTPPVREPMRIGTMDDVSPEALGLRPGVTTLDEARARMRDRELTGIAEDAFVSPAGPALAVIGADYQRRVHVFVDGLYRQSLDLPTHGGLPYGLVLRLGADATSTMLLAVQRDPLGRASAPPTLVAWRWAHEEVAADAEDPYAEAATRDGFVPSAQMSLARITQRHGGMLRPILVGAELDEGVLLLARDRNGTVWDKGYLVRTKNGEMALAAMPWAKAMRCSCVQKYSLQGL